MLKLSAFLFITSIYTSGRLVIDSDSYVNLREVSDPSENLKIENINYNEKNEVIPYTK